MVTLRSRVFPSWSSPTRKRICPTRTCEVFVVDSDGTDRTHENNSSPASCPRLSLISLNSSRQGTKQKNCNRCAVWKAQRSGPIGGETKHGWAVESVDRAGRCIPTIPPHASNRTSSVVGMGAPEGRNWRRSIEWRMRLGSDLVVKGYLLHATEHNRLWFDQGRKRGWVHLHGLPQFAA
jgi:hypothetical protein